MGGAAKGFGYEREISRFLSLWWTFGDNKDIFWRTEGSGGRATNRRKNKGKKLPYSYGDIGFKHPDGIPLIDEVILECKKGYSKGCDLMDLLDKKKGDPLIIKWWNKAEEERKQAIRNYIWIIFRRNGKRDMIITNNDMFINMKKHLHKQFEGSYGLITANLNKKNTEKFFVASLEEWFEFADPYFFKEDNTKNVSRSIM